MLLKRASLRRAIFGLFKSKKDKKTEQPNPNGQENKNTQHQHSRTAGPDEFEMYDQLKRKMDNEMRARRGERVNIPEHLGQGGISEIYFFGAGVSSVPDIASILRALATCKELGTIKDSRFKELYFKILESILTLPNEAIPDLYTLGHRYEIDSEEYWRKTERKIIPLLSSLTQPQTLEILKAMSSIKQAYSEVQLNLIEKIIEQSQPSLSYTLTILDYLRQGKMGSEDFTIRCVTQVQEELGNLEGEHLVLIGRLFKHCVAMQERVPFEAIENIIVKKNILDSVSVEDAAAFASQLRYEHGGKEFNFALERSILRDETIKGQPDNLIACLVSNYKLSTESFNLLRGRFEDAVPSLSIHSLCSLEKYTFMAELEKFRHVEAEINRRLEDEIGVEELLQVTLCFHLTRSAARDTYRRIEREIRKKANEILLEVDLAQRFHTILAQSNLCTPELLILFQDHAGE